MSIYYIFISAVKQLIVINLIQNNSFSLHYMYVMCIFIVYV